MQPYQNQFESGYYWDLEDGRKLRVSPEIWERVSADSEDKNELDDPAYWIYRMDYQDPEGITIDGVPSANWDND